MKILSILLLVLMLGIVSISAQTESSITKIRAEVASINKNVANYKKVKKDVEDISLEGTEATYFSSGNNLRKITAKMYGESFKATGEYYFQGENLIFAYEKISKYNGTIGMNNLKVVKVEEHRLYLVDGKIIHYLIGNKTQKAGSDEFNEKTESIIGTADKLKKSF